MRRDLFRVLGLWQTRRIWLVGGILVAALSALAGVALLALAGRVVAGAVARAFLRDSPLVLLDEPTSHLDPGTEAAVLDALRRLCVGRTAIVATHARAARGYFGRTLEMAGGRATSDRMAGN